MRSGNRLDTPDNRHRDVMSLFGRIEGSARKEAEILFRLERLPSSAPAYLIRSSIKPEHPTPSTQIREDTSANTSLGSLVAFRLSINAIQRLKAGGIRSVASDLDIGVDDSESDWDDLGKQPPTPQVASKQVYLTEWLREKLSPALEEVSIMNHQREVLGAARSRSKNTSGSKVIQVDLIDGVARIADTAALGTLLSQGVGRARSYGCGLLTINKLP